MTENDKVIKKIRKEEIIKNEYVISGKAYNLFIEWVRTTKLSKQKKRILKYLDSGKFKSLKQMGKDLNLSEPLICYHVNGNYKNSGLVKSKFIKSKETKGKVLLTITPFGKDMLELAEEV